MLRQRTPQMKDGLAVLGIAINPWVILGGNQVRIPLT